jgi:hypothetical protein
MNGAAMTLSAAALVVGLTLCDPSSVSAQAAYGSYIGVGGSVGLTDGGLEDGEAAGGVVALRYRFSEQVPLSIRAQALISDTTAIVPTLSYDIPLNWYTDAYIGAGIAIQDADVGEEPSPVGEQTSFVIQPGIDYNVPRSRLVIFGNAIIAFDAYRNSSDAAAALQAGVGLRF